MAKRSFAQVWRQECVVVAVRIHAWISVDGISRGEIERFDARPKAVSRVLPIEDEEFIDIGENAHEATQRFGVDGIGGSRACCSGA